MIQGAAFRILACFYDTDEVSFVDLCNRAGYPTDLGGYYIRQLIKSGYLEKVGRGQYRVLPEGKQQIALYYGKYILAERPRLSVLLVIKQADAFIVVRRKVQPFINVFEWPAGVVNAGESLRDAALRIAKSRLGIDSTLNFQGFFRRIDIYDGKTFDDKLFAVHVSEISPDNKFNETSQTGDNLKHTEHEIRSLERRGRALLDVLDYVEAGRTHPEEHTYELVYEDFSQIQ